MIELEFHKIMTITELTEYLINRYSLDTENKASINDYKEDGMGGYRKQIVRILKRTEHPETHSILYENKIGKTRKFSAKEFYLYCFDDWKNYLTKSYKGSFNTQQLKNDCSEIIKYKHKQDQLNIMMEKAQDTINQSNEMLSMLEKKVVEATQILPRITISSIDKIGLKIMISALFDLYYEPLDWTELRKDYQTMLSTGGKLPPYSKYVKRKKI
jgi:hypothetical protein